MGLRTAKYVGLILLVAHLVTVSVCGPGFNWKPRDKPSGARFHALFSGAHQLSRRDRRGRGRGCLAELAGPMCLMYLSI